MAMYMYDEDLFTAALANPNYYGSVNVLIPKSGKKGGRGFADVVMYDNEIANIYEIKPQSYYDDAVKNKAGKEQLDRYIEGYNKNGGIAIKGGQIHVEPLLYFEMPFLFDENRTIIYRMYDDSDGMIYYEFSENSDKQTAKAFALERQKLEYVIPYLFTMVAISSSIGVSVESGIWNVIESKIFPIFIMDEDILDILLEQIINRSTGKNVRQ